MPLEWRIPLCTHSYPVLWIQLCFRGIDMGVVTTILTHCESKKKVQESTYDFISVSWSFFARSCALRRASISAGLYIFAFGCLAASSYVNTANSTT
jgi:hypothetical protein